MKKITLLLLAFLSILLFACSGSDTYRGNWKGMSTDGEKVDIVFDAKQLSISDSAGSSSITVTYSQNSVNISNSIKTYGIKLGDGRSYQVQFPIANNENVGVLLDGNGNVMYTIGRTEYVMYEDLYRLK